MTALTTSSSDLADGLARAAEIGLEREALEAAYKYITQPLRMTQTHATYDTRNYNALTAQIRKALGRGRS